MSVRLRSTESVTNLAIAFDCIDGSVFRELLSDENESTHEPKKLSTPVLMNEHTRDSIDQATSALFNMSDRTFIRPMNETSTVSQKKLEKVEAKLREKQEKRARDNATNGDLK